MASLLVLPSVTWAHDDPADPNHPAAKSAKAVDASALAKQSQNPVAKLISVPFENNSNFGVGPADNYQNVLNVKPVLPQQLNGDWNFIHRGIQPIIAQDNLTNNTGALTDDSQFGLGDVTYQGFLSPTQPGKVIWGVGPVLTVPWGKDAFTSNKWSAGPAVVVLTMPGRWVIGSVFTQQWDFAGKGSAEDVSLFNWQYFINYNFDKGWYATTAPNMTANWKAQKSSDKWTIPVGGGGGRVMKIGNMHVNFKAVAYAYATTPDAVDTDYTIQLSATLLFPK